jgi:hypothetical protein
MIINGDTVAFLLSVKPDLYCNVLPRALALPALALRGGWTITACSCDRCWGLSCAPPRWSARR